ncbi:HupE/UreJ family protein [Solimonas soli]|uniref:HupE/UreJ family protein n=1 Tax=Solimonas soli TaxID=413479 RepID=UPI00047F567B|nr:HupE/UreJ family protein [Solimonas soli]
MSRKTAAFLALALLAAAAPAFAHPGHDLPGAGFVAGLLHPLSGFDHLLAMIAVGVWAAQLGGRARWMVPLAFVTVMAIGAATALAGFAPPHVEAGISASLLVLGLFVATAGRLPLAAALALTGAFAFCHGAAHGSELPALADPLLFAAGFMLATALLHGAGLGIGYAAQRRHHWLARAAGVLTAAGGLVHALA